MANENCNAGGVFVAFLAGGLIGAGLALLYAPVSGKEARGKTSDVLEDMKKMSGGTNRSFPPELQGARFSAGPPSSMLPPNPPEESRGGEKRRGEQHHGRSGGGVQVVRSGDSREAGDHG